MIEFVAKDFRDKSSESERLPRAWLSLLPVLGKSFFYKFCYSFEIFSV